MYTRLLKLLPAILRVKDLEAAGQFPARTNHPLPIAGLSSDLSDHTIIYNHTEAGLNLSQDQLYFCRYRLWDGSAWASWTSFEYTWCSTDYPELLFSIPYTTELSGVTHFHVQFELYDDRDFGRLIASASSLADQEYWYYRPDTFFEKLFYAYGDLSEEIRQKVKGLRDLHDPYHCPSKYLLYLAYIVGGELPPHLTEVQQREFVAQFGSLSKLIGTHQGFRNYSKLWGDDLNATELFKSDLYEVDDYSYSQDALHPIRAARLDIFSCQSGCENYCQSGCQTGQESIPCCPGTGALTPWDSKQLLQGRYDIFRPIHVLVCYPVVTTFAFDSMPVTLDTLGCSTRGCETGQEPWTGSVVQGTFRDLFPAPSDSFELIITCALSCESACQLQCEYTNEACLTSCEQGCQIYCETDCQLICEYCCMTGCEWNCEGDSCQVTCQSACQSTCQQDCMTICQGKCQSTCQLTWEVGCTNDCECSFQVY